MLPIIGEHTKDLKVYKIVAVPIRLFLYWPEWTVTEKYKSQIDTNLFEGLIQVIGEHTTLHSLEVLCSNGCVRVYISRVIRVSPTLTMDGSN
jgi:hypothetical protein